MGCRDRQPRLTYKLDQTTQAGQARDFSYPLGQVSLLGKHRIGHQYASARSVYAGINTPRSDLLLLRANPLFSDSIQWATVRLLLAKTIESAAG